MRKRLRGRKLGRTTAHRQSLERTLVCQLFQHERVITSIDKAKEFRASADRIITCAKRGGLDNYRYAISFLRDKTVAKKLFDDIAPRYKDRPGGYTRVLRLGGSRLEKDQDSKWAARRLGDQTERALWELVERRETEPVAEKGKGKAAKSPAAHSDRR